MKRLTASVSRLTQVLHGIANGITVQDPDGRLVFVNRAAARMMNCATPEEAVAKGGRLSWGSSTFVMNTVIKLP